MFDTGDFVVVVNVVNNSDGIVVTLADRDIIGYKEIIAGAVGKENTYGTIVGRIQTGPFTYCRVTTDDLNGEIAAYVSSKLAE